MIQTIMQIALGIMVVVIMARAMPSGIVTLLKAGKPSRAAVKIKENENI